MKVVFVRNATGPGYFDLTAENETDMGNLDNALPRKAKPEGVVMAYERPMPNKARVRWHKATGGVVDVVEKLPEMDVDDGLDEMNDDQIVSECFKRPAIKIDSSWERPDYIKALRTGGYRKPPS